MYINEEADYNDENRYPVFIVLTYGNNPLGMAIKHFTGDEWTHSLISFNPELSPMYSFAARTQKIKGPHSLFGYTYQGTTDNWYKHKQTKYLVYVMYVNKFAIKKMKDHVNYFTSHEKDFKYDFVGLANIARNKDSESHRKYFCSRFVAEVIGQGVPLGKLPSLYRPQELKDLNNISLVNAGTDMYMYNPKVTISNLKKVKNKIYNKFNYQEKYIEKEDENMSDYLDLYLDYIVEESSEKDKSDKKPEKVKKPANHEMIALYKKNLNEYKEHMGHAKVSLKHKKKKEAINEVKYAKQNIDDVIKIVNTMDISTLSVAMSQLKKGLIDAFKAMVMVLGVDALCEFTKLGNKLSKTDEKIFGGDVRSKHEILKQAEKNYTSGGGKADLDDPLWENYTRAYDDWEKSGNNYKSGKETRAKIAMVAPFAILAIKEIASIAKASKSDDPVKEMNACRKKILKNCFKLRQETVKLENKIDKIPG